MGPARIARRGPSVGRRARRRGAARARRARGAPRRWWRARRRGRRRRSRSFGGVDRSYLVVDADRAEVTWGASIFMLRGPGAAPSGPGRRSYARGVDESSFVGTVASRAEPTAM